MERSAAEMFVSREEQGDLMISMLTDAPRNRAKVAAQEPAMEVGSTLDVRLLSAQASNQMVQLFKLLADETRLQILYFLTQRPELNVGTLCELLDQSQPAVSHHLALMRGAGFLEMRRDGKHNFYRLEPTRFQEVGHIVFSAMPAESRGWRGNLVEVAAVPSVPTSVSDTNTLATSGG